MAGDTVTNPYGWVLNEELRDSICREFFDCGYASLHDDAKRKIVMDRVIQIEKCRAMTIPAPCSVTIPQAEHKRLVQALELMLRCSYDLCRGSDGVSWECGECDSSVSGDQSKLEDVPHEPTCPVTIARAALKAAKEIR